MPPLPPGLQIPTPSVESSLVSPNAAYVIGSTHVRNSALLMSDSLDDDDEYPDMYKPKRRSFGRRSRSVERARNAESERNSGTKLVRVASLGRGVSALRSKFTKAPKVSRGGGGKGAVVEDPLVPLLMRVNGGSHCSTDVTPSPASSASSTARPPEESTAVEGPTPTMGATVQAADGTSDGDMRVQTKAPSTMGAPTPSLFLAWMEEIDWGCLMCLGRRDARKKAQARAGEAR